MRDQGLRAPLRKPLFRRLLATYSINEMGDWMGIVALSVLVYEETHSPYATAALFFGTRFLPAIFAPLLVTRVEKPPPRLVLPIIYCLETAAFGALALLVSNFSLAAVIVVATIDGALALAGRALTRASVVTMLSDPGELRAGNAALAGLVVAALGLQAALFANAASFYLVAWILVTAGPIPHAEAEEGGTRERVRAGIAYVRRNMPLRRILLAQALAFVFFSAVSPIEVIYAKESLGTTDTGYGVMLAAWGVGMLCGSLVFAGAKKVPLAALFVLSTLVIGASYLGLAIAPNLAVACVASVIGGTGNGVQWVSAISSVQELTEAGMQARVMAVLESIGAAMPGLGFAIGGLIAAIATPRATFLVAGLGVLAIVALAIPLLRGGRGGRLTGSGGFPLDESDAVVLELLPGGMPIPNSEVEL
jgi:MFS family permease